MNMSTKEYYVTYYTHIIKREIKFAIYRAKEKVMAGITYFSANSRKYREAEKNGTELNLFDL